MGSGNGGGGQDEVNGQKKRRRRRKKKSPNNGGADDIVDGNTGNAHKGQASSFKPGLHDNKRWARGSKFEG